MDDPIGDAPASSTEAGSVTDSTDFVAAVVLASASVTRAKILRRAGVNFAVDAAAVDEDEIKRLLHAEGAEAIHAAEALAELKATRVSERHANALVIGADQILECDGTWFDKPADLAAARRDLEALRGRTHWQATSVCVVKNGAPLWLHSDRARLVMRDFSDDFLGEYLAAAGDDILGCVGAYQIEGIGAQLFASIEGDYFSILGLPLLPLLDALRGHGAVTA